MSGKLFVSRVGEGPAVILLHGLFGSGNNLGALARSLRDRYTVYSVDLPNHGRSAWVEQADHASMAAELLLWMDREGVNRVCLVGHSLGGKVAMQLALEQPGRVTALVAADIAPVAYPEGHDAVFAALDAVAGAACRSRSEAAALMARYIQEQDVIQFLLTSLVRQEAGYYDWRFNLRGLQHSYAAARAAPVSESPYPGPVLFIKGGDSNYIRDTHREATMALFPRAELKVIPGAGHWLHAERPELFNSLVGRFLDAHAT